MKIAIINDSHFGARSDNQLFLDYFVDFFENQFFPYLRENNITEVLHLGDFMDRRKFVNFNTLGAVRNRILTPLREMGVRVHIVPGNHDTYYRNTNDLNSLRELFADRYDNFHLYEGPVELEFDSLSLAMIPWINKENSSDIMEFLSKTKCPIICGHFELDGYEVMRGYRFEGGMSDKELSRFEMVLSGHFHNKSSRNNVYYLGTQYQITFHDLHEKKGFHILDTETRNLEYIENPRRMFHQIVYDDEKMNIENVIEEMDFSAYANSFIKILVMNKKSPYTFDRLLDKLYEQNVQNITIVEETLDSGIDEEDILDMAQDTLTIINKEIDTMENLTDKSGVKNLVRELYLEALSQ